MTLNIPLKSLNLIFQAIIRRKILVFSLLFLLVTLPILYLVIKYQSPIQAAWFNDNWLYRATLTIGNTGSADSNKKVKFDIDTATLITAGKLQSDCGDSRFTDINGRVLKYFIDTAGGACNTASTDYYVLVPTIFSGNTVLYHYYGNPSAENGTQSSQFSEATFTPTSGPTAGSEEKSAGPVAYWKFDEGYGTNANDSTQNSNTGTFGTSPANPTWQTEDQCISGKCLKFDGSDDYVSRSDTATTNFATGSYTIGLWVKPTVLNGTYRGVINKRTNSNYVGWTIYVSTSNKFSTEFASSHSGPYYATTANSAATTSTWYYVTSVVDRSNNQLRFYINGIQQGSAVDITSLGNTNNSTDLLIGHEVGINKFSGFIDEPKIYPYARTAAQIRSDFNSQGTVKGSSVQIGSKNPRESFSQGLVGYWKMDEAAANSCTGGVNDSCDSSGNGNDGAWAVDATSAAGKFGNGVTFDGTDDYVNVPTSTVINHTTNGTFSIGIWVKPNTLTSSWRRGIIVQESYLNSGYRLGFDNGGAPRFWTDQSGGTLTMLSSTAMTINQWNHILVTYNNQQAYLYLNGIQVGSSTGTYIAGTNAFRIGAAVSEYYSGQLDETRIYNRALSPKEVRDLYNWAPGPVGYWNFDEKTGTNAYDISGNSQTGTINGNPTWVPSKATGAALNFDGTGDYVSYTLPSTSPLKISGALTLSYWMNTTTGTSDAGLVGTGIETGYQCTHHSGATLYCYISSGANGITATLGTGAWKYISFTWDGTTGTNGMKLYIDGVLTSQRTSTVAAASGWTTLQIGKASTDYNGKLDDVKIYNYARSSKQITEDMNAGHPAPGSPVGSAVGYWKMDEGYGTTANNQISGQPNFTFASSPNDPSWDNAGKFGKAVYFDGALSVTTEDYADATYTAQTWDDGTLSVWIKPDSIPASEYYPISDYNGVVGENGGWLVAISSNGGCSIRGNASYNNSCPASTFQAGQWLHLAWVVSKTQGFAKVYANGKLINTVTGNTLGFRVNAPLRVGMGSWCGTASDCIYPGFIDEVKIYNSALTEDEIKLDYNHGAAMVLGESVENRDRVTSGQTLYLDATDKTSYPGSGTVWYDRSGNGYNATLSSPTWNGLKFTNTAATLTNLGSSVYPNISTNTTILWVYPELGGGGVWNVTDQDGHTYMTYSTGGDAYINTWETGGYTQRTVWNATESVPHQIVITKNGSVRTVYDNLVQKGQVTITNIATSVNTSLVYGSAAQPMGLSIVETYNRVLSMDEITQDYYAHAYKFNINAEPVAEWKLDEKTGTNAYDTSGNGNTGTWNGTGSHWALGKVGASGQFNGTSDYVVVSDSNSLDLTRWTTSFWVKFNSAAGNQRLFAKNGVAGVSNYFMWRNDGNTLMYYGYGNGTTVVESSFNPNFVIGQWYYLTYTYNGSQAIVYIDGVQKGSFNSTQTPNINTGQLDIGYSVVGGGNYFGGTIDQFRIYDYARTPAQIAWDYNRGSPVGHWKLDECQGGTANDASGNANNGTITIGVTGSQTAVGTCTTASTAWGNGVTGKYNSSLNFDGTDDYVDMGDPASGIFDFGTGDFTFTAWTYRKQASGDWEAIIDKGHYYSTTDGAAMAISSSNNKAMFFLNHMSPYSDDVLYSNSPLSLNQWYHIAGIKSGSYLYIYVNGTLEGTSNITNGPYNLANSAPFTVGKNYAGARYFNGQIDDVKIFNYALTANQVKTLYNQGSAIQFAPATGSP